MSRARTLALIVAVALASAAAGAGYYLWARTAEEARAVVERIYAAKLPDLTGTPRSLGDWRGKVLVVNFWATWCAPCREEIPVFVKLQARDGARGLQFVGIAVDEPARVAAFAREFGINYPVMTGALDTLELLRQSGNHAGVLPYTLIIDRSGRLVSQEAGGLKEARLDALLTPLY